MSRIKHPRNLTKAEKAKLVETNDANLKASFPDHPRAWLRAERKAPGGGMKRRLVHRLPMGPYTIKVYEVDGLDNWGETLSESFEILLAAGMPDQLRSETLVHEVLHTASNLAGLDLPESAIATLSLLACQALGPVGRPVEVSAPRPVPMGDDDTTPIPTRSNAEVMGCA